MERLPYLLTVILTILILFFFSSISQAQSTFNVSNKSTGDTLFTIDGNGNVGIGTPVPGTTLDVLSDDAGTNGTFRLGTPDLNHYLYFYSGQTDFPHPMLQWNGVHDLRFGTSFANEYMRLTNEGNLGLGTANPTEMLEVADTIYSSVGGFKFPDGTVQATSAFGSENGFLSTGTFGTGSIPTEGAGTRMMWYPGKAAFRAGQVYLTGSTFWNDDSIGNNSIASGYNTVASGDGSIATGESTSARGQASTAIGVGTISSGDGSFALGSNSIASGQNSMAMGDNSTASGQNSVAMNDNTAANNINSIAMGTNTEANGENSIAMGWGTTSESFSSVVLGRYNLDSGLASNWQSTDQILSIGDGTSISDRSNLFSVLKNGNMWIQGSFTQNSDINLKSNIEPIGDALKNIQKINGVTFQWENTEQMGDRTEIGVIAQDVEKVYPELVGENEGYKTTNYIGLIPVLIEALKEQQKIIDDLNGRIEKLENIN